MRTSIIFVTRRGRNRLQPCDSYEIDRSRVPYLHLTESRYRTQKRRCLPAQVQRLVDTEFGRLNQDAPCPDGELLIVGFNPIFLPIEENRALHWVIGIGMEKGVHTYDSEVAALYHTVVSDPTVDEPEGERSQKGSEIEASGKDGVFVWLEEFLCEKDVSEDD